MNNPKYVLKEFCWEFVRTTQQ